LKGCSGASTCDARAPGLCDSAGCDFGGACYACCDCASAPADIAPTVALQVLPSNDPLDRPEFDAIDFINKNFPSEQSLERIQPFSGTLTTKIELLDSELSSAVQEQSTAGIRAARDIADAKQAIEELFQKIKDIKSKAEQSELMVAEICRDIKQLDYAKKHLQTTITAQKRLHMLVTAVDQLEFMASKRQYADAANLLEAVKQLLTHFENYLHIPKVEELRGTVNNVKVELKSQIITDFRMVGELGEMSDDNHLSPAELADACGVVDALGGDMKKKLVDTFCNDQLKPYGQSFKAKSPEVKLELTEKRYEWYRRLMRGIDSRLGNVFPSHWKVPQRLCIQFCEETKKSVVAELGNTTPEQIDVTVLLRALQKTLLFEKEISERFDTKAALQDDSGESEDTSDEMPPLKGVISTCFDPYMVSYIALEKDHMNDMMKKVMAAAFEADKDEQLQVFKSSVQMFMYIKNSIRRCTALTTGTTFFKLFTAFQDCLSTYAGILGSKLPSRGLSGFLQLAPDGELAICYIVNTCEYCAENLPKLQDAIQDKVDEEFKEKIDLDPQRDGFYDTAAQAVGALVGGLESKLEPALISMSKLSWATWEDVGDQSNYIIEMGQAIQAYLPTVRKTIYPMYFLNFCDKVPHPVNSKDICAVLTMLIALFVSSPILSFPVIPKRF
jgi:hypothetical protein